MLPDQKLLGQIGDRRLPLPVMGFDRAQGLVLLGRHPQLCRRFRAEGENCRSLTQKPTSV
jgi:hypothetical protein